MAKSKKKEATVHTAVRLPESIIKKAKQKAEYERRSFNWIMVEALTEYVNQK